MAWRHRLLACIGVLTVLGSCGPPPARQATLGEPETVAPGVDLYRSDDRALVNNAGPIAVSLLRIDPTRVRLTSALSHGRVLDMDTVEGIAGRVGGVAAINGGFFNRKNGEPAGLLKVDGRLVSDTNAAKGAVVIQTSPAGGTVLTFDRLAARVTMTLNSGGSPSTVPIDGVDTTRARGKLMLYTPAYYPHTDTAPTGTEWVLDGEPLRVVGMRVNAGRTPIPPRGAVLSFGGTDLPDHLKALVEDVTVTFETTWRSAHGLPASLLDDAQDIVNGAGLLRRDGEVEVDWGAERLSRESFTDVRHPRSLIGVDAQGVIWLATVDGRQPAHSIGMTFADLQRLCDWLELASALNLDGGGSATMVVRGQVVSRPSDPSGPRPVSDAIVVMAP